MEQIQKTRPMPEQISPPAMPATGQQSSTKPNQVGTVILYGIPIVSLVIEAQERLCLAQISNTLLKQFSYNEIHNRRVALGITCVQCTPVQLEILRRAGAMPVSSRRCGMITRREAERLCKSFLGDNAPPRLPEDFAFSVHHECAWGCRGSFLPSRYNSSRAKCIKCSMCGLFFSPNKFIFHSHRVSPSDKYVQPDAANFNSWRRHMKLSGNPSDEIVHAWEDVKAMFNGGTRKRLLQNSTSSSKSPKQAKVVSDGQPSVPAPLIPAPRIPNFQDISLPISRMAMDFMYHKPFAFSPYTTLPWLKRNPLLFPHDGPFFSIDKNYQSAFKPVHPVVVDANNTAQKTELSDDDVDIETTDDKEEGVSCSRWSPKLDTEQENIDTSGKTIVTGADERGFTILDILSAQIAPPAGFPVSSTVPEETMSVTPKPDFSTPTDRMWNITRLSFDRMDRNNLLYRHDFQRHFIVGKDEPPISRSPLPLTVKPVMDCTACQNHHSSIYPSSENNKLPS